MKKIFTLSVAVLMLASAFAQNRGGQKDYGFNKGKDVVMNDGGFRKDDNRFNDYAFGIRQRDMQIAQINQEYDRKVQNVKKIFFLSRYKKDQMIFKLEDQRKDEIRTVYAKFDDRNKRGDWSRH
ncbi:MAG: hypothetical protein WDM90_19280 [Ferruginibacter sp.]